MARDEGEPAGCRPADAAPRRARTEAAIAAALVAVTAAATRAVALAGAIQAAPPAGATQPAARNAAQDEPRTGGWRLADSASPYLRQHADNPVPWHPWGEAAFAEARRRDVPIFLSVGYSTCHWCHVMEHESFEDPTVAAYLAEHFVSIKVDREERPDVDAHYMDAVNAFTRGQGGWPMTLFLTPLGKPFGGGTYFPPEPGFGRPSFRQLLESVVAAWESDRTNVDIMARRLDDRLDADPLPAATTWNPLAVLDAATQELHASLDPVLGGSRGAPKFPPAMLLQFLLRQHVRTGAEVLDRVEVTLDRMAGGGLRDQVGGGFHRYSTDPVWHVPHFEKMLYDNALLAWTYAEAFAVTGAARHAEVARDTLRWVLDDLRAPSGLFYSARDADSLPFDAAGRAVPGERAREGLAYLWTPEQLVEALGEEDGAAFARLFQVSEEGNFEHGRSIPDPARTHEQLAADPGEGIPGGAAFARWLDEARARLRETRGRRPQPFRDEKILAGWNGLMLSSLARCADLLGDARLAEETRRTGRAVVQQFAAASDAGMPHQLFEGRASGTADLADHALVARGLLDAYTATGEPAFLRAALELAHALLARFEDPDRGAFFRTAGGDTLLGTRGWEVGDGAVPSGASVAVELLARLAPLDDGGTLRAAAERALGRYGPLVAEHPWSWPAMLAAIDAAAGPLPEIVLDAGPGADEEHAALLSVARAVTVPALLIVDADAAVAALAAGSDGDASGRPEASPPALLANRAAPDGEARAWVCRDRVCLLPAATQQALREQLAAAVGR